MRSEPPAHRSVTRGASLLWVGFVTYAGLNLAYQLILARWIGPANLGRYLEAAAIVGVSATALVFGTPTSLVRFLATLPRPESATLSRRVVIGVLVPASVACAALVVSAGSIAEIVFADAAAASFIRIASLGLPFAVLAAVTNAICRAEGGMGYHFASEQTALPAVRIALLLGAIAVGAPAYSGSVAFVGGLVASASIASFGAYRVMSRHGVRGQVRAATVDRFRRFAATRWAASLLQTSILWADTLLLGVFASPSVVGEYGVATRIVLAVALAAPALSLSMGPRVARNLENNDSAALSRLYGRASRWSLVLTALPLVWIVCFSEEFLGLFGQGYVGGAQVVALMTVGVLVDAGAGPAATFINYSDKNPLVLWALLAQLCVNLVLNLLLIPTLGADGAAIAWSASLVLFNALSLWQVHHFLRIRAVDKLTLRVWALTGLAFVAATTLPNLHDLARASLATGIILLCLTSRSMWGELMSAKRVLRRSSSP
ncbi:MAG: polysaccharide biosynthesis C-terminal domain-containing protein [Actinomycetota bacterium]